MAGGLKTWTGARFAHDSSLACGIEGCDHGQPGTGLRAQAAPLAPPLHNPETKSHTWYHGTTFDPVGEDHDEDDHGEHPGGTVEAPHRVGSEYGENVAHHWNTDLGSHFTSLHNVAKNFATGDGGGRGGSPTHDSRVLHAGLHMKNPAHFENEHEMGKAAIAWAHDNGHHFLPKTGDEHMDHRVRRAFVDGDPDNSVDDHGIADENHAPDYEAHEHIDHLAYVHNAAHSMADRVAIAAISHKGVQPHHNLRHTDQYLRLHPDREEITEGWRSHLESKGHDGITYGNQYEGPDGHRCAIAFPSTVVHHKKWEWLHPDKAHLNEQHRTERPTRMPGQSHLPLDWNHPMWQVAKAAARDGVCPDCKGNGKWYGNPEHSRDCYRCKGSGTFASADHWDAPDLTPEQADASTQRDGEDFHSQRSRQLEHAKNPTPGTVVWRGEVRHKDHVADPPSVGMHWTTEPGQVVQAHPHTDDHVNVVFEGRVDHPSTQAIPRSHPSWGGRYRSMDSEMEVRLHPGSKVHVTRSFAWHGGPGRAEGMAWPSHPERTAAGWAEHKIGKDVDVAHKRLADDAHHIDYSGFGIHSEAAKDEDLEAIGRSEHPNVDHYRSGGIGHRDGDPTFSTVGFLPTHVVRSYREHGGDWNPDSHDKVAAIRKDLEDGKGLHNPIQMEYDDKEKWAYIGEGNHRVEAAHQAGLQTVPVRVYGRGHNAGKKSQGIGGPAKMTTDFGHNGYAYTPPDIHPDHFEFPGGGTHAYDYSKPPWGNHHTQREAAVMDDWAPHERLFAPTKDGVDPRLFTPDKVMKANVRLAVLVHLSEFWHRHGYDTAPSCVRVYLAGSQASEWYGNNDFDILVGINYDEFRKRNPMVDGLSDAEVGTVINGEFREDFNDEQWHPSFDPGVEWHLTGYVNKDSWDIRNIKPYAAYNVTDDVWAVEPLHEPEGHHFDVSEMYYFEGVAAQVRAALGLREPNRRVRCTQLWTFIHTDRSRAFGPHGSGAFDRGNALEKYLDQASSGYEDKSLMAALAEAKFGLHAEAVGQEFERAYQRPFSPMGSIGDDQKLPVGHIFKHPEIEKHPAEYSLTMNYRPTVTKVRTDALRPTQPHVDEGYIHRGDNPHRDRSDLPGVIKDMRGRYRLVDGHHRAARALLNGETHMHVQLWDEREAFPWKTKEKKTGASTAPTQRYYLPEHGGKYHRANPITGQAMCRGTILLDVAAMPFHVADDAVKVHPMVCRKCLGPDHPANAAKKQAGLVKTDLERAHDVIRHYQLKGPSDGPGEFTWPKHPDQRRDLADFIYDQTDEHVGRAVLDAPDRMRTTWEHRAPGMDKTAHRAHDLYGSNDIDKMFPGESSKTTVPWPSAPRTKSQPIPYRKDLLGKALANPEHHLDQVDPRDLHAYQPEITRAGVKYYMGDKYRQTGQTFADGHHVANQIPVVYTRADGKRLVLSGHHRAAAALLKGEPLQCIHIREEQADGAHHAVRDAEPVSRRASAASVADGEGEHGQRGPDGDPVGWHRRAAARLLGRGRAGAGDAGSDQAARGDAAAVRPDGLAVTAWYQSDYPPDHPDHHDEDRTEFQPDTEAVKNELDRLRGGPKVKRSELREHMANGTVPKHLYRAISESDFRRAKSQGYLDTHGEGNWMRPDKGEHAEGMVTATDPHEVARTYLPNEGGRVIKIETHPEHGWRPHSHDYQPRWQTKTHDTKVPWEHIVDHSGPIERRFNPDTWSSQDAVQMKGEGHEPADHATADNLEYFKRVNHPAFHHLHPFHPDHARITTTGGLFGPPWFAAAHDDEIEAHHTPEALRMGMTHHTSPQGHRYRLTADDRTVYAAYLGKGEQRLKKPQMVGTLNWFGGRATPDDTTIKGRISHIFVKPAHQRRGLASAMLDHARTQNPHDDIAHSTNLSEDAKGWSSVKASKGQRIEVAGIAIKAQDTGRVLMLQRSFDDESDPARGTWEFPGGHIDEGENPFQAARREWCEETGGTFPDDAPVVGNWVSGGMYQGFVVMIAAEADLDINLDHEDRHVLNPDDPDGDGIEVVAWWDLKHLKGNPAVRKEVTKGTDWDLLKKAKTPGVKKAATWSPDEHEKLQHTAPSGDDDVHAPFHDVESMMPDFYTHPHYYTHSVNPEWAAIGRESTSAIRAAKGNPEHDVTVYRAVPHGVTRIGKGDWVTPSRGYAKMHGYDSCPGCGKDMAVISGKTKAKHLFTEGDPHEWGYSGDGVEDPSNAKRCGTSKQASADLPQHWKDHIESFKAYHAEGVRGGLIDYSDPKQATGQCLDASGEFKDHVQRRNPEHHASETFFEHLKEVPPRRPNVEDGKTVEHMVNITRDSGHVIDWTARQFHPGADFPHVEHVSTYHDKWHHSDLKPERCAGCKEVFGDPDADEDHLAVKATRGLGWHHVVKSQRGDSYPHHAVVEAYIQSKTGTHPADMVWTAEPYATADATPDPHGFRSRTRLDSAEKGYRENPNRVPPIIAIEHDGKREHVDGWHRLGGAERAGLTHVPAYVGRLR